MRRPDGDRLEVPTVVRDQIEPLYPIKLSRCRVTFLLTNLCPRRFIDATSGALIFFHESRLAHLSYLFAVRRLFFLLLTVYDDLISTADCTL